MIAILMISEMLTIVSSLFQIPRKMRYPMVTAT
jgi:hypothetical protein